jgi:hypothetical protein
MLNNKFAFSPLELHRANILVWLLMILCHCLQKDTLTRMDGIVSNFYILLYEVQWISQSIFTILHALYNYIFYQMHSDDNIFGTRCLWVWICCKTRGELELLWILIKKVELKTLLFTCCSELVNFYQSIPPLTSRVLCKGLFGCISSRLFIYQLLSCINFSKSILLFWHV